LSTIRRDIRRLGATVATVAIAVTLVAAAPVARAEDATGTPTPTVSETSTGTTTAPPTTTEPPSTPTTSTTSATPPPTTTLASSPVVLRSGATGLAVKDLQSRLAVLGRSSGTIDGVYDSGVATALAGFLAANALPGDGSVLTEQAWTKLKAQTASPLVFTSSSTGDGVRDLQVRLKILGYWPYSITGRMESALAWRAIVVQRAKDLPQSGVFDRRTVDRIIALTNTPVIYAKGSSGYGVKEAQLRLKARGYWPWSITGVYGDSMAWWVRQLQRNWNLPQRGVIDQRTWSALVKATYTPGTFDQYRYYAGLRPLMPTITALDTRCRTGRVMCVNKTTRTLTWVVDGKPLMVMWARFGGISTPTREGTFQVFKKYEYVISNLYFTPMPYSMFFSGGQAVHYSSNFARLGYAGSSHGCVNIADYAQIKSLYYQVRIGDKVVVYH